MEITKGNELDKNVLYMTDVAKRISAKYKDITEEDAFAMIQVLIDEMREIIINEHKGICLRTFCTFKTKKETIKYINAKTKRPSEMTHYKVSATFSEDMKKHLKNLPKEDCANGK